MPRLVAIFGHCLGDKVAKHPAKRHLYASIESTERRLSISPSGHLAWVEYSDFDSLLVENRGWTASSEPHHGMSPHYTISPVSPNLPQPLFQLIRLPGCEMRSLGY